MKRKTMPPTWPTSSTDRMKLGTSVNDNKFVEFFAELQEKQLDENTSFHKFIFCDKLRVLS